MQYRLNIQPKRWSALCLLMAILFVQLIVAPLCHAGAISRQHATNPYSQDQNSIGLMCIVHPGAAGANIAAPNTTPPADFNEHPPSSHTNQNQSIHCDACVAGGSSTLLDTHTLPLPMWDQEKSHELPFNQKRHPFSLNLTRPLGQAPPIV